MPTGQFRARNTFMDETRGSLTGRIKIVGGAVTRGLKLAP